jgi:hypothetical protein
MKITIAERRGVCRWCRCTDAQACAGGCEWVNDRHTLCSSCTELDSLVREAHGREVLAQIVFDNTSRRRAAR